MNILSVSHYYPPHIGGLENVAHKQVETLKGAGHTVRVLTFAVGSARAGYAYEDGVAVIRVRAWNIMEKKFGIPFPFAGLGLLWHMWKEVRNADAVHIHDVFYMTSWVAYIFARLYQKPVMLTQHVALVEHTSALVMWGQRIVYATFGRCLFRYARTIIVYNENVRAFVERYVTASKLQLIRNGIDTTFYHPPKDAERETCRELFGLPLDRPLALFVGRFVPKKGYDVVYEARDNAYDLVFAGSGDFPETWKQTHGIHFLGALDQEQLARLYRAVDVLVSPNIGEVFTLVTQEAMASGLPVIMTDDPGYAAYDLDRRGVILCPPQADVIREHLLAVTQDATRAYYMREYSLSLAKRYFDWYANSNTVVELYATLERQPSARDTKKRLLIVAPYFYPKIGGVENYAYHLAKRLDDEYDVTIVTSNPDTQARNVEESVLDGMHVYYLPVWKTLSNTPLHPFWFFMLWRIIQKERPDIINVHSPVPFMADMAAYAAGRRPIVVTYHSGSMIKNDGSRLINGIIAVYEKLFLRILFYRVNAIVAVSHNFLQSAWRDLFGHKMVLIRPGVDTTHFTSSPLLTTKTVTYVGRVEHTSSWKGIEELLQAMVIVLQSCPDARLEIVGSGDAIDHYAMRARDLGIAHAVTFSGSLAGRNLVDAYQRSNVVVLPSTSEAEQSSVVLIEAMASGRPVIGTRIGGTPYIVQHEENGLLVEPRNIPELAHAIVRIITDSTYAESLAEGAVRSAQKVDWSVQIEKYKTLFASLIPIAHDDHSVSHRGASPKTVHPSRLTIVGCIALWWSVVVSLSFYHENFLGLLNIAGFGFLMFVPGFLTLGIVGVHALDTWVRACLMIAVSILELVVTALLINTFLPLVGIEHPLTKVPLLIAYSMLVAVLCLFFWRYAISPLHVVLQRYVFFSNTTDAVAALMPLVFVALSVIGTIRLNNGADNSLTVLMLILTGIYIGWLTWLSHRGVLRDSITIPFALWCVSLALLLMTSLRGWYTTGHDIQVEFHVFELVKDAGFWSIAAYRDAYNACMSITILPTIFSSILKIYDPYVYKVLFQIIFAVVPGVIYVLMRRYVSPAYALIASFYFIAFPTFFTDMPMLNRQEIAFLFWALMICILFEDRIAARARQLLFVALGMGMILSHYSTTYTVIALLSFLILARVLLRKALRWPWFATYAARSAVILPDAAAKPRVAVWMVVALIAGSFVWTSVLTDTSSGSLYRVVTKTFETIRQNSKEDTRSSDVLYSIFSWGTNDPEKNLASYKEKIADPIRTAAQPDTFYDTAVLANYPIHAATTSEQLTGFGRIAAVAGIEVSKTNDLIRQMLAKVVQILIIIGFLSVLIRKRFVQQSFDTEFFLLAVGNVLMVASQVILPVLSSEYGVLRAFEQSLMFLGILIVVGGMSLGARLSDGKRFLMVVAFTIVFFYAMTGVFAQLLVRHPGQLHLSNAGMYYDAYYTHESELKAIDWLNTSVPKSPAMRVQTDHTNYDALHRITDAEIIRGIYPSLIQRDSYVLLTYANVHTSQSMVLWNSNIVKYTYPMAFLDDQKDLLYDNGGVRVYR